MEKIILLAVLISAILTMAQFPDRPRDRRPVSTEIGQLGERPIDNRITQTYSSYPGYRLLVTYFREKESWPVERLLATTPSGDDAPA